MRRLKLQTQVSLDGYMAGPGGELDWMTGPWSDDVGAHITALMAGVDTILLGRRLAEGFIPHWAAKPEHEPDEAIEFMNGCRRVVVSRTLQDSPWDNADIVSDLAAVAALKAEPGGDIIAYGGATLVAGLVDAELVDELCLFVHPVVIGEGRPVFGDRRHRFEIVAATLFGCGILGTTLVSRRS